MKVYTKESLIDSLLQIRGMGWVPNSRPGNSGAVGNTLEDLLGIEENNLPIPNAAEWELKAQRLATTSLTTLFHQEPSPTAMKLVVNLLLPKYGWHHQTIPGEMSFRQTVGGKAPSDRGFKVVIDRVQRKVLISFSASAVSPRHAAWLDAVRRRAGLGELSPQPYWGFDDLRSKAGTKLHNCFYVQAQAKRIEGREFFFYDRIMILERFDFDKFLKALDECYLLVDFDARTGHNHGTKFRLRQNRLPDLYDVVRVIK